MTVVLKLGGSVVTDKDEPETVADDRLSRAADAVAAHAGDDRPADLVLVHGAGSFGHHHASRAGVSTTEGTHDAAAIRAIHGAMRRLNDAVVEGLAARGVPSVPVHPFSAAYRDTDAGLHHPTAQVATMLEEGFVPILHGDVVTHAGSGATILSGDEIVVALARAFDADRVGLCSAVPGVLDAEGEVVPHVSAFEEVAEALDGSDATDVTGGMAGKVRELLALDAPAYVFDLDGVAAFLAGESPGTRIQ